jgi:hypothetical protein
MSGNGEQDHADAILGLLRADAMLGTARVFDGVVPSPTPAPPYVLVYMHMVSLAEAPGNALAGLSTEVTLRAICHCVGGDAVAARAMAQRVRGALLDVRPVIAGRSCGLIRQESSQPPVPDESTGVVVYDSIDTYRLTTEG